LPGPSAKPFPALKVTEPDRLGWVRTTQASDEICLVSNYGSAIIFNEDDVRPMGLAAAGVLGIRLDEPTARVVAMDLTRRGSELLLVTRDGLAKRTPLSQFPRQRRHGKGVLAWKSGEGIELAGGAVGGEEDRFVAHLAKSPDRSMRFTEVKRRSRAGAGPSAIALKTGDEVTGVTPVISRVVIDMTHATSEPPDGSDRLPEAMRETARKGRAKKSSSVRRASKKTSGGTRATKSARRKTTPRPTAKATGAKRRSGRSAGSAKKTRSKRKK
jgi:DNA gyrase subunit A